MAKGCHVPDLHTCGVPEESFDNPPAVVQTEPEVTTSESATLPAVSVFPAESETSPEEMPSAPAMALDWFTRSFQAEAETGVAVVTPGRFPHAAAPKETHVQAAMAETTAPSHQNEPETKFLRYWRIREFC